MINQDSWPEVGGDAMRAETWPSPRVGYIERLTRAGWQLEAGDSHVNLARSAWVEHGLRHNVSLVSGVWTWFESPALHAGVAIRSSPSLADAIAAVTGVR